MKTCSLFTGKIALSALAASLVIVSGAAKACGDQPYLGEVCTFAFDFCPRGFLATDGQTLSIAQNSALFALLGTRYGGDGVSNFKLPDLRGRTAVGAGSGSGLSPVALGETRGAETATLTSVNLPANINMNVPISSNTTGNTVLPNATNKYLAASPAGPQSAAIWSAQLTTPVSVPLVASVSNGGQPISTITP